MSILYGISADLCIENNEKNIKALLQKGLDIEFIYLNNEWAKGYNAFSRLTIKEATYRILFPSEELLSEGGPYIRVVFKDTNFFLWIRKTELNFMTISIGDFAYRWEKEYYRSRRKLDIDFARYTRLLLKLTEDFAVTELTTWTVD